MKQREAETLIQQLLDGEISASDHTRLEEAVQVGDTWIVQAGCYMQGLGVSAVTPRGDGTIEFSYELTAPMASQFEPDARRQVRDLASEWTDRLEADWGVVVGHAEVRLGRTYDEESEMGRWVTWALTRRTGADVAIYNSGGLRSDIEAGPLTRESLYNAFPFGNEVVVAEVPGSALIALALRNSTAMLDPESASIVQQHGLTYTYGTRLGSAELQQVAVGGEPVDPDKTYRVATNSFVMGQAERYLGMKPAVVTGTEESVRDALAAVLQETGPIESAPAVGGTKAP